MQLYKLEGAELRSKITQLTASLEPILAENEIAREEISRLAKQTSQLKQLIGRLTKPSEE